MLVASPAILWGAHELRTGINELRTFIFVTLVLTSPATIYIVRTGSHVWRDWPSEWLLAATAADLVAAGTLALGGWFTSPIPPLSLAAVTGGNPDRGVRL